VIEQVEDAADVRGGGERHGGRGYFRFLNCPGLGADQRPG
jgi:hypothetical protein